MKPTLSFLAARNLAQNRIELKVGSRDLDTGKFSIARNIIFSEVGDGAICDTAIALTPDEARLLLDELWRNGVRPSDQIGSEGERSALTAHIADLQLMSTRLFQLLEAA